VVLEEVVLEFEVVVPVLEGVEPVFDEVVLEFGGTTPVFDGVALELDEVGMPFDPGVLLAFDDWLVLLRNAFMFEMSLISRGVGWRVLMKSNLNPGQAL